MAPAEAHRPSNIGLDMSHAKAKREDRLKLESRSSPSSIGGIRLGPTLTYAQMRNSANKLGPTHDFSPLTTPSAMRGFDKSAPLRAFHREEDDDSSSNSDGVSILESTKLANMAPPKMDLIQDGEKSEQIYAMDKLLAELTGSNQKARTNDFFGSPDKDHNLKRSKQSRPNHTSSSNSLPRTPATENSSASSAPATRPASTNTSDDRADQGEVLRLKLQLAQAHDHISKLGQELSATRSVQNEVDGDAQSIRVPQTDTHNLMWQRSMEGLSEPSGPPTDTTRSNTHAFWQHSKGPYSATSSGLPIPEPNPSVWFAANRALNPASGETEGHYHAFDALRNSRISPEVDSFLRGGGNRRHHRLGNRSNLHPPFVGAPSGYQSGLPQYGATPASPSIRGTSNMNVNPSMMAFPHAIETQYQQAMPTSLSPHASEFMSKAMTKNEDNSEGPTFIHATEPLNYRRLLDRNVNCNWKYIVDKIVCNNDQQASIFLQQKLKVGTPEQKYEIVEAIVAQAFPLMVNRFGNFLVQRCFEHGTPDQVIKIAEAIRGNTLSLSMDPFGCHVVQKAFDSVPEEYKAVMVHELLRRIPETVIHRYACHVWQKLFELRWTESPPQIMQHVNQALRGMWHEVALGETGSLVVQNIFENCLEDDKRPCIEEVLANIDIVAHGQFGNWCIQHVCEHGAPPDRGRAIDHVIRYAAEYSIDQFASKVVEKCLKIGGSDFMARYLDRLCEGRQDRTRIPLIDIASDQYGNYLIQWILNNSTPQHREMVAAHIRKHMVSLRGSKFGSRVGMLCTNPAVATRPGPGAGPGMGGVRIGAGPRYGPPPAYR